MEQLQELVFRKECPCCKSTDFIHFLTTKDYFLTQEEFNLVRCTNCNLVFTNPLPKAENLAQYYDSPDYFSHKISKFSITGFIYNQLRNINLKGKYRLVTKFVKNGNVLDIGQGTGEFLLYMRQKDWNVQGVEPNPKARQYAIDTYNLPVVDEKEIPELKSSNFDLITMWHVLEHVLNLDERLLQIRRMIKTDGFLIIAVPNLNSPDSVKFNEKWAALDVPRHLYHFTKETMNFLLNEYGFKVVLEHPLKLDAYYVSLLSEKYRKNIFPYPAAMFNGFLSNRRAQNKNNYSSMVFVAKPI